MDYSQGQSLNQKFISQQSTNMGCSANKEAPNRGSIGEPTSEFIALVRKISIEFQMQADRLLVKGKQLRHELKQCISKSLNNRSRQGQFGQLEKLTFLHHFHLINQHLNLQCRAIIDRQVLINQLLVTSGSLADYPVLRIPIQHILFSISIIHDGKLSVRNADLKKFQDIFAHPPHCILEPKGVDFEWLQFYKHNLKPTAVMIKQMAFNFCNEEGVDIKKFHQVGLLFKY